MHLSYFWVAEIEIEIQIQIQIDVILYEESVLYRENKSLYSG